jgi:hypothetical protein
VKDHLKEGIFLPSSNRWGELIRPDGTANFPNEIEYKCDHGGSVIRKRDNSKLSRANSTSYHATGSNVYNDFSIEDMNKSFRYAFGLMKKLLHSMAALIDIDTATSGEKDKLPRTLYGWEPGTGQFKGDKAFFDNMALNRLFASEKAYTDKLVRVELVAVMTRQFNGVDLKYANLHVKIDSDSYGSILVPCDMSLGQHNIRNMMVESINATSVVIIEPYSHKNGQVSHWASAILVKKFKRVLWYFKANENL